MERFIYGLVNHSCTVAGTQILLPIGVEKYSSKLLATAQCQLCGTKALDKTIDRTSAPTKSGYIMTA